jgi:hypothetical protein
VVEDYDGDGKDDIAIVRPTPSNFLWYVQKSTGGVRIYNDLSHLQSNPTTPVTGDFDGDGFADLAAYITFDGSYYWYLRRSGDNGFIEFAWGLPGDKAVAGDYDGDGKYDVAVYRPSNGTWYIRRASGGSLTVTFGIATDIPVPADYDGDGKTDVAIWRRDSTQAYYWVNGSQNGISVFPWGLSTDTPVSY